VSKLGHEKERAARTLQQLRDKVAVLELAEAQRGKLERENSHLAAELENYSGLQVSVISWRKAGARELPSSGGIGELLRASGQFNFMADKNRTRELPPTLY
jgi:hypothetical protein